MIRFQCPACNVILQGSDAQAGNKIACPKCGQRLQIPQPPANPTVLGKVLPETVRPKESGARISSRSGRPQAAFPPLVPKQQARPRSVPFFVVGAALVMALVAMCAGTAALVALVLMRQQAGTQSAASAPTDKPASGEDQQVSVDSDIKEVEFGQWKVVRGKNGFGMSVTALVTTAKNVGNKPVDDWQFQVTLYDKARVKKNGGLILFPALKPGETGQV
jgi:hypothetical protein